MMEVISQTNQKKRFREACLERLKKRRTLGRYKRDKMVLTALSAYIKEQNAKRIMLYIPLALEVNLVPLILQLRKEGKVLYVPFMEGESFGLVKYRLPLEKKQFGIKEPKMSRQYRSKKIDIAIIPIVGVDVTHRRIGFGKGMYDRFFEKYGRYIGKRVFVARELCYSSQVLTNHYDIRADRIITP